MSKPRYWWYGNVCRTIGEYPKLSRQVRDMSRQKITPGYSSQPGGQSSGRAVEDIAVRVLSSREYEDYTAIQSAINTVQTWRDGGDVLEIVRLFRVRVVDVNPESLTIEATGAEGKIDALLGLLEHYGVIELVRSGAVAVTRGPRALSEKVVGSEVTGR